MGHNYGMIRNSLKSRFRQLLCIPDEQISQISQFAEEIVTAFKSGNRLYAFGNGGSASEAQHFTTELIGRFKGNRRALPAISLNSDTSAITCIANDFGFEQVFSRQLEGLLNPGDIVVAFSTSGTSLNVLKGLEVASALGAKTTLLTGSNGQTQRNSSQRTIALGGNETALIQEIHLAIIHIVCDVIEVLSGFQPDEKNREPREIIYDYDLTPDLVPKNKELVWVNGCFDIIHEGHLLLMEIAAKQGNHLIVGLNSDASVRQIKGEGRPFIPELYRAKTLARIPFVDQVIIFSDPNPLSILRRIAPHCVVKDSSYESVDYPEKDYLIANRTKIVYTSHISDLSTTAIISRLHGVNSNVN